MPITNSPDPLTPQGALSLVIQEQIAVAKNVTYPTLSYLSNKKYASQKTIRWVADVGGEGTNTKDVTEDFKTNTQGKTEPASLPIGQTAITHNFDLDLTEVEQAMATAVPSELKNLFQAHVKRGLTKMFRELNRAIYQGDGTKPFARVVGLNKVADPTYSYAGIDVVANPNWKGITLGNGGVLRDMTDAMFRRIETEMLLNGSNYDLVAMHPLLGEKYKNIFAQNRSLGVSDAPTGLDAGISTISYNGRPILQDADCNPSTIYFIDSSDIELYTYRVKGDATLEGLAVKIGGLPTLNIYSENWEIGILPQLKVHNRRSVNILADIK